VTHVHRKALLTLVVAAIFAVVAATAQPSVASRDARGRAADLPTLKVVFPTTGADVMIHLAQARGFFTKRGVNVEFTENAGANALPILVAGQADLEVNTVAAVPLLTLQGKDITALYAMGGGGQGGSLIASTSGNIRSTADLQALNGKCRIGSGPSPQATFGYANYYNLKYKLGCDIVPIGDVASQLAALANGNTQALVTAVPNIFAALEAGQVRILRDTRIQKQRVGNFLEVVLFAQKATAQSRKADIAKFLKALNDAAIYLRTNSDLAVAQNLTAFGNWSTLSVNEIATKVVAALRPYIMVQQDVGGYITPQRWKLAMHWLTLWGLPNFSENDTKVAYANQVDMSPYIQAIGKPKIAKLPVKKKKS
jgi:ABC-type nitrate/sulfonate/bicarbonate transport system substrate-binding protein